MFSERAGVVNIALEGIMGVTALDLVWGAIAFQSVWMGCWRPSSPGSSMGLIHAVVTVTFKVDHVVSGVAINVFAIGLSRFLCQSLFGAETQSKINPYLFPKLLGDQLPRLLADPRRRPAPGSSCTRRSSACACAASERTPRRPTPSGVNVNLDAVRRGRAVSGALCGIASATLFADKWITGMVAGRGFIALAAVIFGRWDPLGAVLASLLFGYADTFRIIFESQIPIPSQFVQMFPYVLALVVLAGLAGKSRAPTADGKPFLKGEE